MSSVNESGMGGLFSPPSNKPQIFVTADTEANSAQPIGMMAVSLPLTQIRTRAEKELLLIMAQQLKEFGLNSTATQLAKESGLQLENPVVAAFQAHVMKGEWQKAEMDLIDLKPLLGCPDSFVEMKFLLLEQKYLEVLEDGCVLQAFNCLRQEITPLNFNTNRVHELSSYLMCGTTEELKRMSKWGGKGPTSRQKLLEKLQGLLPCEFTFPPKRLQILIHQAIELQKDRCPYHKTKNTDSLEDISLLVDHSCTQEQLPSEAVQVLEYHYDEVRFCQFSNNGMKLATGSRDTTVIIWDINPDTLKLSRSKTISGGPPDGVFFLCWSPDDTYLIACGPEGSEYLWIWNAETGDLRAKVYSPRDSLTTCAWHKDGKKFVVGGTYGQFYECDIDGNFLECCEGIRVECLCYQRDGKTVLAADTRYRIKGYNFENPSHFNILQENHPILSFTCDKTGKLALVNVATQGVHLWDIEDCMLLQKFKGVAQGYEKIYSCFVGKDQMLVASGSEDNNVYIWSVKRRLPLTVLTGHTDVVNCVAWNSTYQCMLASASNDGTIKIWMPNEQHRTNRQCC